jgi:alpha-tubulin suppressor-like RCC1 family protein
VSGVFQLVRLGYVTGKTGEKVGPGGTVVITPQTLLDTTKKLGAKPPTKGQWVKQTVLGKNGLPQHGVRAVWLAVQTQGKAKGALAFRKSDGGNSKATLAPISKSTWTTSLTMVPLDAAGAVAFSLLKGKLKALRMVLLGYVADTSASDAISTIRNGLIPVAATAVKTIAVSGDLIAAQAPSNLVPTKANLVLLQATVVTRQAGKLTTAKTAEATRVKTAIGTTLPKRATAQVLLPAETDNQGGVYILKPKGARVLALTLIGHESGQANATDDGTIPTVTIQNPPNGEIDAQQSMVVPLSGTVSAVASGLRNVIIRRPVTHIATDAAGHSRAADNTVIVGSAQIDETVDPPHWSLTATLPAGHYQLSVTVTTNAGRYGTIGDLVPMPPATQPAPAPPGFGQPSSAPTDPWTDITQLESWGDNSSGQLGDGTVISRTTPQPVPEMTDVTSFAAGQGFAIAARADGTVFTWGDNSRGMLGNGSLTNSTSPQEVPGLAGIQQVAAANQTAYALSYSGQVYSWGGNQNGQLGNGLPADQAHPGAVVGLTSVSQIAALNDTAYALREDGTVWAWGSGTHGAVGDDSQNSRFAPVKVADLTAITEIAAGGRGGYALKADGTVWAWGANNHGELGNGGTTDQSRPVRVLLTESAIAITAGPYGGQALLENGKVASWGVQSGDPNTSSGSENWTQLPITLPELNQITAIRGGCQAVHAISNDGSTWAWGSNEFGQLGDGTTKDQATPIRLPGLNNLTAIGCAHGVTMAVTSK